MTTAEKFEAFAKAKDEGNQLYRIGKWRRSLKKYKKAQGFVDSNYDMKDDEKVQAKGMKVISYLNMAACNLKLSEWKEAIQNCDHVIKEEKNNVKALFRRGQAYISLDQWQDAQRDLDTILEIEPENKEAKREIARLKRKRIEQDKKDRRVYARIFQKLASETGTKVGPESSSNSEAVATEPMEIESNAA